MRFLFGCNRTSLGINTSSCFIAYRSSIRKSLIIAKKCGLYLGADQCLEKPICHTVSSNRTPVRTLSSKYRPYHSFIKFNKSGTEEFASEVKTFEVLTPVYATHLLRVLARSQRHASAMTMFATRPMHGIR